MTLESSICGCLVVWFHTLSTPCLQDLSINGWALCLTNCVTPRLEGALGKGSTLGYPSIQPNIQPRSFFSFLNQILKYSTSVVDLPSLIQFSR